MVSVSKYLSLIKATNTDHLQLFQCAKTVFWK